MTRMSKKGKRRALSPRKNHYPLFEKTGPKKDDLPAGYREHVNSLNEEHTSLGYIPKIK